MTKRLKSDMKVLIRALVNEVIMGTTHLAIVNGLNEADPVVLGTASVFFGLTIRGHLEAAQMYAAKLFDTHRDAETIHTLLSAAGQNAHLFSNATSQQVDRAVGMARQRIKQLDPIMKSVRARRNKVLAHLDPETVRDAVKVAKDARLTLADLSKVFDAAHGIVNEISILWMKTSHLRSFPFDDDYKHALDLIAEAECARIQKYERDFKAKWTAARPKGCPS